MTPLSAKQSVNAFPVVKGPTLTQQPHPEMHMSQEWYTERQVHKTWIFQFEGRFWKISIRGDEFMSTLVYARVHSFHSNPNHPAKRSPDSHGRNENASGHFTTIADNDKANPDNCGQ